MKSAGILLAISPLFLHENSGLVDQSKCGSELQCYQLPTDCDYASSTDGCTLVSWEADTNGVNFAITHKAADAASYWAAFALAKNPTQMADGDAYFCYLDSTQINPTPALETRYFSGMTRPPLYTNTELTNTATESENNVFECRFYRPDLMSISTGPFSISDYDTSSSSFNLILANGGYDSSASGPQYHASSRMTRAGEINFKNELAEEVVSTGKPFAVVGTEVHGVFMILAWGIFAGISLFTAKNGKDVFKNETFAGRQDWFMIHVGMNACIFVFTLIATLVMFAARDWAWIGSQRPVGSSNHTHAVLGITVIALLGANVILGLIRPDKSAKMRPLFEIFHSLFGNAAHSIGIAAIVFGLNLFRGFFGLDPPGTFTWPAIIIIVAHAVDKVFDLVCAVIRYKKIDSKLPEYFWYISTGLTTVMGIAAIAGIFV
jgi:hypothetical protein